MGMMVAQKVANLRDISVLVIEDCGPHNQVWRKEALCLSSK